MKRYLIGYGLSSPQAQSLVGLLKTGLTATGTTKANALSITHDVSVCTTVAAGTGVILRADLTAGDWQEVTNHGANALAVYPPSGGTIAGAAVDAAFSIGVGKTARFRCIDNLNFTAFLSA